MSVIKNFTKKEFAVLIVPGLWGSGETHWQTIWEQESPEFIRVQQEDWNHPCLHKWMKSLNNYVTNEKRKVILVAHSLACSLVAHWAYHYQEYTDRVHGALLVAPTDCDVMKNRDKEILPFCPMPTDLLPFNSAVVASHNDECVSFDRATYFAKCWGSRLIDVGNKGHINADSSLENWEAGRVFLNDLL